MTGFPLFFNKELINSIRVVYTAMFIHCNTETAHTKLVVDIPLLHQDAIWFHFSGIVNVLLLDQFTQHYLDTYYSHNGNVFLLQLPNNKFIKFKKFPRRPYYHGTYTIANQVILIPADQELHTTPGELVLFTTVEVQK